MELTLFGSIFFTAVTALAILGLIRLLGMILDAGVGLGTWMLSFFGAIFMGVGLIMLIPFYWGGY